MRSKSSRISLPIALLTILVSAPLLLFSENPPTTREEQAALTPDAVLTDLVAGNARYVAGNLTGRDIPAEVAASAEGQFPKAVVLSCLDSRVPVEEVFDQGIGDLFVARVAGNVENEDILGSMEFATKVAGARLIIVLGHGSCGAVKGACDGVTLGNLTGLLAKIRPAVESATDVDGERNSKNEAFVAKVIEENVRRTVADVRAGSDILAELESAGTIKIVGAVYSMKDGSVAFLE